MPSDDALRVLAAIPDGHRRARNRAEWQQHVEQNPAVQMLREDARRNLFAVLWVLARYTDRRTSTTRPTWARLMALTGLSRSTVAAKLQWARQHRLIGHVEHGSTERYRTGQDPEDVGNRAAVYVLLLPLNDSNRGPEVTRTPSTQPLPTQEPALHTRACEHQASLRSAGRTEPKSTWSDIAIALNRRDRRAIANRLRDASPVLRRLTPQHLQSLVREFLMAGWCVRTLLRALDYQPDGSAHPYAYDAGDLRSPAGWVAHRLRWWRDQDGKPLPCPRQQRIVAANAAEASRAARPAQPRPPTTVSHIPDRPERLAARPPAELLIRDRDQLARVRERREAAELARLDDYRQPIAAVEETPQQRSARIRRAALQRAAADRATRTAREGPRP